MSVCFLSFACETGLKRCGKSCRLRWVNYLSPSVNRSNFTEEEDDLIIRLHNLLGNRWLQSPISSSFLLVFFGIIRWKFELLKMNVLPIYWISPSSSVYLNIINNMTNTILCIINNIYCCEWPKLSQEERNCEAPCTWSNPILEGSNKTFQLSVFVFVVFFFSLVVN